MRVHQHITFVIRGTVARSLYWIIKSERWFAPLTKENTNEKICSRACHHSHVGHGGSRLCDRVWDCGADPRSCRARKPQYQREGEDERQLNEEGSSSPWHE